MSKPITKPAEYDQENAPKPGIITAYARGGYTVIAWIDTEGGYQETTGQYDRTRFTLKTNGGPACPLITNEDRS